MTATMATIRSLLAEFLQEYPFQPATAWWRAIEIAHLSRHPLPGGLGLDVGCGDGRLTRIIDRHWAGAERRWIGIDPDPSETALAEQLAFYTRVLTAPGDRIALADASCDFALSNSVLEHIPHVEPVLAEVARVLKPGAPFLLTVPSAGFHLCLRGPSALRRLVLRQDRAAYLDQIDRRVAHEYYWDAGQWRQALTTAGFSGIDAVEYFTAREVQRWETLSNLTGGLLYEVMGRRPPIEIQRTLGLRGRRMPASLAKLLAQAVSAGRVERTDPRMGGLIVVATRGGC